MPPATLLMSITNSASFFIGTVACDACMIAAATEDPSEHVARSSTPSQARKIKRSLATQTSPPLSSVVVFNAYSITSAHITNGQCVTTSGSPITLPTPYSFTENGLRANSIFRSSAMSAFIDYLGFTTCVGGGESATQVALVPVDNGTMITSQPTGSFIPSQTQIFNSSVTSTLSSQQTSPSASAIKTQQADTDLSPRGKIGIGIGASLLGIILLFFALRDFLRYRKRKIGDRAEKQEATSREHQPYFQPKGELEAEERGKYELEAEERRYELEENGVNELEENGINELEEDGVNEMAATEVNNDQPAHGRQELRGEEHCQELNGSGS